MHATDFAEARFLNVMNGVGITAPSDFYIGLYLSSPTETGMAGNELNYTGYTRQIISFGTPTVESLAVWIRNVTALQWATPAADAGTVTHIGISDAVSGGNMWLHGQLTEPLAVKANQFPSLPIGEVGFYMTGNLSAAYKTKFLNVFRKTNVAGISCYLAMFNGSPDAGGVEISGDTYARPHVTWNSPTEQVGGQMLISNTTLVSFPIPTTAWGSFDTDVVMDAAAMGSAVWIIPKTSAETIMRNNIYQFQSGAARLAIN